MGENGPKLIRKDGIFYILFENETIQIEDWEAEQILADHSLVYDVIVTYRRKFDFNTTQDNKDFL